MFVVSGPGPATTRATTSADINGLLAAVSGQKIKFAGKPVKGKPWPKYYGIQPTGVYPDEPFVKELYYSNASTGLILSGATKVPVRVPPPPPPPRHRRHPTSPISTIAARPPVNRPIPGFRPLIACPCHGGGGNRY